MLDGSVISLKKKNGAEANEEQLKEEGRDVNTHHIKEGMVVMKLFTFHIIKMWLGMIFYIEKIKKKGERKLTTQ